jgi:hypothetical protein
MPQDLNAGDFLVFQLEAGFALLRVLERETDDADTTWHVAAYSDFFPDVDAAEAATSGGLSISAPHLALTDRAFESTQVARIANAPLTADELQPLANWRNGPARVIHDRSVRLLLGLR